MISNRRFGKLALLPLFLALAGAAGCSSTSAPSAPEGTQAAAQDLAPQQGDHGAKFRGPPGPEMLLVAALQHTDIDAGQRATIQTLLDGLKPDGKDQARPDKAALSAVAEQVRAGSVDVPALVAKLDASGPMSAERRATVAKALDTLHATLTASQRQTVVDALSKKIDERAGDHREHEGERAHEHGPRGEKGGPMSKMLEGLALTSEQQTAIDKVLEAGRPAKPDMSEMKKHFEAMHAAMTARLATFATDSFDAKAFVTPPAGADAMGPRAHLEHMAKTLSAVVPLLTPAQRETLATNLEKGAMMPGGPREGR